MQTVDIIIIMASHDHTYITLISYTGLVLKKKKTAVKQQNIL